jgi:hypothetical protein
LSASLLIISSKPACEQHNATHEIDTLNISGQVQIALDGLGSLPCRQDERWGLAKSKPVNLRLRLRSKLRQFTQEGETLPIPSFNNQTFIPPFPQWQP